MTEKTIRDICLEYIEQNPGVTTSELAAEVRKTRPTRNDTITMTLNRLRVAGLIDRMVVNGVMRNFHRGVGTQFGVDPKIYQFDQLQAAARARI